MGAVLASTPAIGQDPAGDDLFAQLERDIGQQIRVQVLAIEDAIFLSPQAGRIGAVRFREGEYVTAGDTILSFVCDVLQAELVRAKALANRKQTELQAATRGQRLGSESGTAVAIRQAELGEAEAEVAVSEKQLKNCTIAAPFDGQITDLKVKSHYTVSAGQDLFRLVNNRGLELKTVIPAHWLGQLSAGDAFTIKIDETGRTYSARIERFGGRVDPVSQSIPVFGSIDDQTGDLLSGMSGQAEFRQLN
ncbi:efflux RND transporter periplasmic adaptor subunit [Actibacterium sp. 188UL27-1]|uniref:efflux RND transporter periplasmic adaptor subunit n=1 Tax=Actibacterium sp. 188UL27-1 TaxID=2786961 RepID=UPI00195E73C0|nr:efflux RND transporter periplasmic adaptor subunit [Actibacterium sp. 188UL27-1]MBM7069748.1 efflux RND transporter periplasmic adaptor subunit [Actibacterium sp. 188UL27-1]